MEPITAITRGDLVMAAEHVTPDAINFMAKHGRGLICLTLTEERGGNLGTRSDIERARLVEQHRRIAVGFEQGPEMGAHEDVQTPFRIGDAVNGCQQARPPGFQPVDHGLLEQFLLAPEMIERAACAHANRLGDVTGGRGVEALVDEKARRRPQQLGAAVRLESGLCPAARHG